MSAACRHGAGRRRSAEPRDAWRRTTRRTAVCWTTTTAAAATRTRRSSSSAPCGSSTIAGGARCRYCQCTPQNTHLQRTDEFLLSVSAPSLLRIIVTRMPCFALHVVDVLSALLVFTAFQGARLFTGRLTFYCCFSTGIEILYLPDMTVVQVAQIEARIADRIAYFCGRQSIDETHTTIGISDLSLSHTCTCALHARVQIRIQVERELPVDSGVVQVVVISCPKQRELETNTGSIQMRWLKPGMSRLPCDCVECFLL